MKRTVLILLFEAELLRYDQTKYGVPHTYTDKDGNDAALSLDDII